MESELKLEAWTPEMNVPRYVRAYDPSGRLMPLCCGNARGVLLDEFLASKVKAGWKLAE
jgi:hypothetical protein